MWLLRGIFLFAFTLAATWFVSTIALLSTSDRIYSCSKWFWYVMTTERRLISIRVFSDVQLPRTMARINECPNPNDTGAKSKGLRQVLLLLSPQGNENEGQTSIEVTSFIAKLGQGILFLLLTNTNWALLCIDCVTSDQHHKVPETTGHCRLFFRHSFLKIIRTWNER